MKYVLAAALVMLLPQYAAAQSMSSCPKFGADPHQALDCVEGIFSETPVHLTMSGLPPGNGMPLGVVYDDTVHDVTAGGFKTMRRTTAAIVGSTNASWYATGSFTWEPPLHYSSSSRNDLACSKLGPLCADSVFGLDIYATYRSMNGLSFYGLGSAAPSTAYTLEEREAFGGITLRMPLTNWLRVDGQFEDRKPTLPASGDANSVSANFVQATAPGLSSQPNFFHSAATIRTMATYIAERSTNPGGAGVNQATLPLMKPRVKFEFRNNAGYHWYNDLQDGRFSFQQFVFDAAESISFGSVLQRRAVPAGTSWIVDHLCDGRLRTQTCQFGTLDIKSLVQLSSTSSGRSVPFYFRPTLGGADIESRTSLRGFDNYRFRDNDVAVMQVEYTRTFAKLDPLGVFVFYDAGLVGSTASDMWSSRLRQDVGPGLTIRLQGKVVMQMFAAVGAGHGVKVGYNFEKLF